MAIYALCVLEPLWPFMHFVCLSLCGPLCTLCALAFVALYALCVLEPLWPFMHFVCLSLCGSLCTLCALAFVPFGLCRLLLQFLCLSLCGPLCTLCAAAFGALYPLCVLGPLWPFTRFVCLSLCAFSAFAAFYCTLRA